jgi:hypothetical protein
MPEENRINRREFIHRSTLGGPEGFTANLSSTFNNQTGSDGGGFQILGIKGSLILGRSGMTFNPEFTVEDNRWIVESWPSGLQDAYYKTPKVRTDELLGTREPEVVQRQEHYCEVGLDGIGLHFRNFFSPVKTRKPPIEDALAGHRAASCAHLINRSVREQKMVSWDSSRENLKT